MSESVSTLGSGSAVLNGRSKVPKCLIACSGSVATLKIPELVAELTPHFEVMIICTSSAAFFLEKSEEYNEGAWKKFELAGGWNLVLKDADEWEMWNAIGNSVLHIEMRRWADILVVAPASANLLSKASCGIADNFVLSVIRAWDFRKPCVLCPAMNTAMWTHPSTKESIDRLQSWGWEVLGPVEKVLACNEKGNGAMVSVQEIKAFLFAKWANKTGSLASANALTNANLELHGLMMNSGQSQSTTGESTDRKLSTTAATAATADLFSREKTGHEAMKAGEGVESGAVASGQHGHGKHSPNTLKSKVAANKHTSLSPFSISKTAASAAHATTSRSKSTHAHAEPVKVDTSSPPPIKPVTAVATHSESSTGYKIWSTVLQSFLLGLGIGVGVVVANMAVGILQPGSKIETGNNVRNYLGLSKASV